MLFVSGEYLDLKKTDNPYVKEFYECKKYFDELGYLLKFKMNSQFLSKKKWDDGRVETRATPHFVSYEFTSFDDDTGENITWRYSENMPKKKDGEYQFTKTGKFYNNKVFKLDKDNLDLAFFLYKKRGFCGKDGLYDVVDRDKDLRDAVTQKEKMAGLSYYIYDKNSPLNTNTTLLRVVCSSFGINNVETKKDYELKLELEANVKTHEDNGQDGYQMLLDALNLDEKTQVRADVNKAIERGLIVYDDRHTGFFYTNPDGGLSDKLLSISKSDGDIVDGLTNFLLSSDELLSKFNQIVKSTTQDVVDTPPRSSTPKPQHTRGQLVSMASKAGIKNPVKLKNDDLKKALGLS